jgi:hypothetical protein
VLVEILLRFLIGGVLVTLFALAGNALRPRTFAGIFEAAPSIALASLALTYGLRGAEYVRVEARSMVGGATALAACSLAAVALVRRPWIAPAAVVGLVSLVWAGAAGVAWALLRR